MANPQLLNVAYPAAPDQFLVFDLIVDTVAFSLDEVSAEFSNSGDITPVLTGGSLTADFIAGGSTVSGVGTISNPMHFSLRPSALWPPAGATVHNVILHFQSSGGAAPSTMPADQFTHDPYRMFARNSAHARSDWYNAAQNLIANPAGRTTAARVSACIMVQDPSQPTGSEFTDMVAAGAMLQTLSPPMPWVPGLRTQPSNATTFATLFTTAHWQNVATWLHSMALVRVPGDPRINLDCESYQSTGPGASTEPTIQSIADYNALNGTSFSAAQLRTAMQPFIDQLIADNVNPVGMYPNTAGTPNNACLIPLYIIQALGVDRCCLWWERTFEISEMYRKNPILGSSYSMCSAQKLAISDFDRTLREVYGVTGQLQHIACGDEDSLRVWGKLWEPGDPPSVNAPARANGELEWLFDPTRISPAVFSPTWFYGLDLSALNGADTVFYMRPLQFSSADGGIKLTSVGCRATPVDAELWAGPANSETVTGSALFNSSVVGLQVPVAQGAGNTWCSVKYPNVLPALNTDPWTSKLHDITVPSSVTVDTPIWSLGQNNNPVAMLWWIEATAEFKLYVHASGVQVYSLATGLAKNVAHRVVIGRSGTLWRYSVNGGVAVDVTTPTNAGVFPSPQYGMGCSSDRVTMANNLQCPGTGIIFTDQALHYITQTVAGVSSPGLRSAAEFQQLSYNGPYNSTDHKNAHHNYPFEWFT